MLANATSYKAFCETVDGDKQACFGLKQKLYDGEVGSPFGSVPTFVAYSFPATPVSGGRGILLNMFKRYVLAPGYTKEIGEALGIAPELVKPDLHCFSAATNHHFSAVVEKRVASDGWQIWIQRKGGQWTLQGAYTGKSADIDVPLTTPGDAEQIQVRVQLRKSNADYGQPSDPTYVTLNP